MDDFEILDPDPSAFAAGFREIGYNFETAVADIIDNSVTAGANRIGLEFHWSGSGSWIAVVDNGSGMNEAQLRQAMRVGSKSPLDQRDEADLGRFGLGLKSASFSVCKSLTVLSRIENGDIHVARWDLDVVMESGAWRLHRNLTPTGEEVRKWLSNMSNGTIVLWEKLDRIVGDAPVTDTGVQSNFVAEISKVKSHLEMVFHRFISDSEELVVTFNERELQNAGYDSGEILEPWDPFLVDHPFTDEKPVQPVPMESTVVDVQAYILPHISHFDGDEAGHARASGIAGWNAQQGFYVYRNRRMLVAGNWLDLFSKDEHTKLARIRVDLPNDVDFEWSLDVRKSRVILPPQLRNTFRLIGRSTRSEAEKVYRARGSRSTPDPKQPFKTLWEPSRKKGKFYWTINSDHPLVKQIGESLSGSERRSFTNLLRIIGATVPIQSAWIVQAENPDSIGQPLEDRTKQQQHRLARDVMNALVQQGYTLEEAIDLVCDMDSFSHLPEIRGILEET